MATVTGFTAARMLQIENNAIVSAAVVNGRLILTRNDGTTFDAGLVQGTQGLQGIPGEVTNAALQATLDDTGRGVMGHASVNADQLLEGFNANAWRTITGSTVTFTPVPSRNYIFSAQYTMSSEGADTEFDIQIVRVADGNAVAAASSFSSRANRFVALSTSRGFLAPSTWSGTQSFRVQARVSTGQTAYIRSALALFGGGSLTVSDNGIL